MNKFAIIVALFSGLVGGSSRSTAQAALTAYVFPLTGEIRLSNDAATDFPLVFYEILYSDSLPVGGLNPANGVWLSVTDVYDASGNGFIDPVNQWTELPSNTRHLAEGLFNGSGTSSLPGGRSIGLGKIWNPNIVLPSQLTVRVATDAQPNAVPIAVNPTIDGDYNLDRTVDAADYNVWKNLFGVPFVAVADGNHNGVIGAADYTVWRDHLGQTLEGTAFGVGAGGRSNVGVGLGGSAVPEPTSALLAAASGLAGLSRRRR